MLSMSQPNKQICIWKKIFYFYRKKYDVSGNPANYSPPFQQIFRKNKGVASYFSKFPIEKKMYFFWVKSRDEWILGSMDPMDSKNPNPPGYRIWIPKKFPWIWIPDLDPKNFGPDLDTGSGSQKIFVGFGYRIRIPKKYCWIWIPDLDPKNLFLDLDTGYGFHITPDLDSRIGFQKSIDLWIWDPVPDPGIHSSLHFGRNFG